MKRNFTRLLIVYILISISVSLMAQEKSLVQIMRLHRRAVGGIDAITAFVTARVELTWQSGQGRGKSYWNFGEESKFRESISGDRNRNALSFDGIVAYQVNRASGNVQSFHSFEGNPEDKYYYALASSSALLFPLMNAEKQGASLSLRSQSEESIQLEAVYPDDMTRSFTLNSKFQIVRDETRMVSQGIDLSIARNYSAFKDFDGAVLPSSIVVKITGSYLKAGKTVSLDERVVYSVKKTEGNLDFKQEFFVPGLPERVMQGDEREIGGAKYVFLAKLPVEKGSTLLRVTDINGDGWEDIVAAGQQRINILLGDKECIFNSRLSLTPKLGHISDIQIVDLRADGKKELLVAIEGGDAEGVYYYDNLLDENPRAEKLLENLEPRKLAVGSLDSDSYSDLAVVDEKANKLILFMGNSDGRFSFLKSFNLKGIKDIQLADISASGADEVLVATENKLLMLEMAPAWSQKDIYNHLGMISSLLPFDADGDGQADLAVTRGNGNINAGDKGLALILASDSGYNDEAIFLPVPCCLTAIATHDLNDDGVADLLALSAGEHKASAFINEENRISASGNLAAGYFPCAAVIRDITGDKKPEVIILNRNGGDIFIWSFSK